MKDINGIEYPEELLDLLQPGNVIKVYPKSRYAKEVFHIRAIVDEDQVVVKAWWKHKQRWHYSVEWLFAFKLMYRDGHIEFVKKETK